MPIQAIIRHIRFRKCNIFYFAMFVAQVNIDIDNLSSNSFPPKGTYKNWIRRSI